MNNTPSVAKVPGTPVNESPAAEKQEEKIWTLYYRYGSVPLLHKNFKFAGSASEAIDRARHHCIKMSYKFIYVRPFIVDLDEQEKKREQGEVSA